jgi:hypothetical protein
MARKPRTEFEGALYHIITRGNQRQRIFRGTEDYDRYLIPVALVALFRAAKEGPPTDGREVIAGALLATTTGRMR